MKKAPGMINSTLVSIFLLSFIIKSSQSVGKFKEDEGQYKKFVADMMGYINRDRYKTREYDGEYNKFHDVMHKTGHKFGRLVTDENEPTLTDMLKELKQYGSIKKMSHSNTKNSFSKMEVVAIAVTAVVVAVCFVIILSMFYLFKRYSNIGSYDVKSVACRPNTAKSFHKGSLGGHILGDSMMAPSAHLYHFQHQKTQMSNLTGEITDAVSSSNQSDADPDEEEDVVYECPGLAPTGALEISNPLFQGECDTKYN